MDRLARGPCEAKGATREEEGADRRRVEADLGLGLAVPARDGASVHGLLDREVQAVRDERADAARHEARRTLALREAVRLAHDVYDGADVEEDHAPSETDPKCERHDDGLGEEVEERASRRDLERLEPALEPLGAIDVVRAAGLVLELLAALAEDDVGTAGGRRA